jgi:dTDP-4-dehydrorhamnose reductase
MRVLVTGSKGQLGIELVALLAGDDHHEVLGLDLPEHDLTDRDHVLGVLTTWRPDVVVHAAAMTAVDRCETEVELAHRVNCLATRFVADGARRVGAHVLYVSTDYVFDGTKDSPYVEWDTPNPQSVYGRTKLGGELEIDPGWTIARTSWVCGEHGPNMVRTLLRLAAEDGEVRFVDDQRGHPTFTSDLAPMLATLALGRVPGIFHTTNQGAVSWYELAREVFAMAGADPDRVQPVTTAELVPPRPAPRPANSVLDDLAWRGHGFAPSRDFREPLAELVARLSADRR